MSLLIVFGLIQYVQTYVNDPLEKLKNKMAKKNHPKFELKNVNQKMVEKALTKMKKKECWRGWLRSGPTSNGLTHCLDGPNKHLQQIPK